MLVEFLCRFPEPDFVRKDELIEQFEHMGELLAEPLIMQFISVASQNQSLTLGTQLGNQLNYFIVGRENIAPCSLKMVVVSGNAEICFQAL